MSTGRASNHPKQKRSALLLMRLLAGRRRPAECGPAPPSAPGAVRTGSPCRRGGAGHGRGGLVGAGDDMARPSVLFSARDRQLPPVACDEVGAGAPASRPALRPRNTYRRARRSPALQHARGGGGSAMECQRWRAEPAVAMTGSKPARGPDVGQGASQIFVLPSAAMACWPHAKVRDAGGPARPSPARCRARWAQPAAASNGSTLVC